MGHDAEALRVRLERARREVGQALQVLHSPDLRALEQVERHLKAAVVEVAACQSDRADVGDTLSQARQFRMELGRTKRLLDAGFGFHQGWMRRLGGLSAGYTRSGEPAHVDQGGRLIFRG